MTLQSPEFQETNRQLTSRDIKGIVGNFCLSLMIIGDCNCSPHTGRPFWQILPQGFLLLGSRYKLLGSQRLQKNWEKKLRKKLKKEFLQYLAHKSV